MPQKKGAELRLDMTLFSSHAPLPKMAAASIDEMLDQMQAQIRYRRLHVA